MQPGVTRLSSLLRVRLQELVEQLQQLPAVEAVVGA